MKREQITPAPMGLGAFEAKAVELWQAEDLAYRAERGRRWPLVAERWGTAQDLARRLQAEALEAGDAKAERHFRIQGNLCGHRKYYAEDRQEQLFLKSKRMKGRCK